MSRGGFRNQLRLAAHARKKRGRGGRRHRPHPHFRTVFQTLETRGIRGPAKIEFFKTEPPAGAVFDTEGNRQPAPFASATLPSGKREILLLFVPLPPDQREDGLEYRLLPFDDSMDTLPWGSYRFINFTGRNLLAFAGSKNQRHELRSNRASATISPGGSKRNLQWLIYDNPGTEGKPVFSAQWLHRPNYRSLIFITESTNQRGAINVKSIDEWEQ